MKIILLQDVKNIGKKHEVHEVKDGYAKNFLIHNKLAVSYTKEAQTVLAKDLDTIAVKEDKAIAAASLVKQAIEKISLIFQLKTHNGKVFGSISNKQIIEALMQKHQIKIDKFMLDEKNTKQLTLGKQIIHINLYKNVSAKLEIIVEGA
ncbi:MAG: 50S ribosomal protein L9 [Mycoplasmataceae bacterium]|jgi:large subunit ribosomal protein L9|nr:50S ribosomal protein L9 [Mycoplasmataceae bacterium]